MKLTVLGNNGPFPAKGGACSGYLITLKSGKQIVIDFGSGVLSSLQQVTQIEKIDAIFLSHLHFDHVSDIFPLKYALEILKKQNKIQGKIPLFLTDQPKNIYELLVGDVFEPVVVNEGMKIALGEATLSFYEMTHPVPCFSVEITAEGKRFFYTGDTGENEKISTLAKGADFCLIDACFLERELFSGAPHLSVKQAVRAAKGAKRTLLTHLSPMHSAEEMETEVDCGAEFTAIGREYRI